MNSISITMIIIPLVGIIIAGLRALAKSRLIKVEFIDEAWSKSITRGVFDFINKYSKQPDVMNRRTLLELDYDDDDGRRKLFKYFCSGMTSFRTKDNTLIVVIRQINKEENSGSYEKRVNYTILFLGKNSKSTYQTFLEHVDNFVKTMCGLSYITIYESGGGRSMQKLNTPKTFDSIFFPEKDELLSFLKRFENHQDFFKRKQENTNCGILLYGPPGTGKSSIVKAISSYLGRNLAVIPADLFKDDKDKSFLKIQIKPNSVVVLEDMDSALKEREDVGFNNLMQRLDGLLSTPNTIFILTTNHKDKIDQALFRSGRIDLSLHVGKMGDKEAKEMCDWFEVDFDKIKEYDEYKTPIAGSELRSIILKEIHSCDIER